jgi:short-subunit dehydrogenase
MSKKEFERIWITGASSGIGEALAEQYVKRGDHVVVSARRGELLDALVLRLNSLGKGRAFAVVADVTSDESMQKAAVQIQAELGGLEGVIANAGFGVSGIVAKLSLEDYRRQFETNVYGVIRTVHASLPLLKAGARMGIVGSVAGHVSMPGGSAYSMSKFAVRALAESLWAELHRKGISVTLISPGFVQSDIRIVNNQGERLEGAKDPIPQWLVVPTPQAARDIVRGLDARRKEVIITGHGKVIVFLVKYIKWLVDLLLLRVVENRPEPKEG